MPSYKAPLRDMRFLLNEVFDFPTHYRALANGSDATPDMVEAILGECARLCEEVIAPLYHSGDEEGCHLENGDVRTPKGFKEAYDAYVAGGWQGLSHPVEYGGQGLPMSLGALKQEMLGTANWPFSMYPGLSLGAMNTLMQHGTEEQKQTYLAPLTEGRWGGTMCLTEAQCGTDLGQVKTRAEANPDGSYALTGTKIFIYSGEHDLTENIVHIVLARLPDAPKGTRGIVRDGAASEHRDAWLVTNGYRVLRFWNHDVLQQTNAVLEAIWLATQEPEFSVKPPSPSKHNPHQHPHLHQLHQRPRRIPGRPAQALQEASAQPAEHHQRCGQGNPRRPAQHQNRHALRSQPQRQFPAWQVFGQRLAQATRAHVWSGHEQQGQHSARQPGGQHEGQPLPCLQHSCERRELEQQQHHQYDHRDGAAAWVLHDRQGAFAVAVATHPGVRRVCQAVQVQAARQPDPEREQQRRGQQRRLPVQQPGRAQQQPPDQQTDQRVPQ
ncbi:DUF559 domain-containing protein [Pseudomonas sp. BN415]|nr:DUF559 domain-containing protein [Pseudomonas sp. BN415]